MRFEFYGLALNLGGVSTRIFDSQRKAGRDETDPSGCSAELRVDLPVSVMPTRRPNVVDHHQRLRRAVYRRAVGQPEGCRGFRKWKATPTTDLRNVVWN